MRGHGGPVRAVAVSADGKSAISGSFDTSAIRWSLERNAAEQVLRFHESAVNAVAVLKDGRLVTGGEDGKVAIWKPGEPHPAKTFEGHTAPIVVARGVAGRQHDRVGILGPHHPAVAARGRRAARARRPLAERQRGCVHRGRQDGGECGLRREGPDLAAPGWRSSINATVPTALNAVAVAPDGEIAAAGANGLVYFLSAARPEARRSRRHGIADHLAHHLADGSLVAAAGIRGSVAIIERKSRKVARTLVGPGLPVWSVAFFPDNKTLLSGGTDRMVRRWDASSGDHIGAVPLARMTIRSRRLPAIAARRSIAPASPATRCRPMKATAPGRRSPAFSAAGSRPCPATISPTR